MNMYRKGPDPVPTPEYDALMRETLERDLIELHRQLTAALERVETLMAVAARTPSELTNVGCGSGPKPSGDLSDLLYGAPAIAAHLGLSVKSVRHRIEAGVIPSFKIGGSICARRSSLDAWFKRLEASAAMGEG